MIILGTITNTVLVILGSVIGLFFIKNISKKIEESIFSGIGVFTMFLGFKMSFGTTNPLSLIFALALGVVIGELLDMDGGLNKLIGKFQNRLSFSSDHFSEGLITAFLLFCTGSMTILGAFEEGVTGKSTLLLTKSFMDGFAAIILSSSMGIGVLFSAIPLFILQVSLTLLSFFLGQFIPEHYIVQITAAGGLILVLLGINITGIKKIRVLNFIPALILIVPVDFLISLLLNLFKNM